MAETVQTIATIEKTSPSPNETHMAPVVVGLRRILPSSTNSHRRENVCLFPLA